MLSFFPYQGGMWRVIASRAPGVRDLSLLEKTKHRKLAAGAPRATACRAHLCMAPLWAMGVSGHGWRGGARRRAGVVGTGGRSRRHSKFWLGWLAVPLCQHSTVIWRYQPCRACRLADCRLLLVLCLPAPSTNRALPLKLSLSAGQLPANYFCYSCWLATAAGWQH